MSSPKLSSMYKSLAILKSRVNHYEHGLEMSQEHLDKLIDEISKEELRVALDVHTLTKAEFKELSKEK